MNDQTAITEQKRKVALVKDRIAAGEKSPGYLSAWLAYEEGELRRVLTYGIPLDELERMCHEWRKRDEKIIPDGAQVVAVDFDGCICTDNWPDIGRANEELIDELFRFRENGGRVILWTCRDGEALEKAVYWCKDRGLEFDAVNENLPDWVEKYGNDCRKIGADLYLDDKAVRLKAGAE